MPFLIRFGQYVRMAMGVDSPGTTDLVPDAPTPQYDSLGNMVTEWVVSARYDAVRDDIVVYWQQEAGPYHKAKTAETHFTPADLEDVVAALQRAVRTLGSRRLF